MAGGGRAAPIERMVDRALAVQRPVVLAQLRQITKKRPNATPAEIVRILERRYLLATTGSGAAVGAAAVIPAVTTTAAVGLAAAETVGFLAATALYANSVAEVHGLPTLDPERSRALVLSLVIGAEASELLNSVMTQFGGAEIRGVAMQKRWAQTIMKSLPGSSLRILSDRLRKIVVRRLAVTGSAGIVGKVLPFGVGSVIGGVANHIMARKIVNSAHKAFGPPPLVVMEVVRPVDEGRAIESRT